MKKDRLLTGLSSFLITILLVIPSVFGQDRGVTDTTVKIGSILDFTGPAATVGTPLGRGHQLYVDYINSQGGVNGRKIIYIAEDHKYSPPQCVAAARKLINIDKVFLLTNIVGTAHTESISPYLERTKTPLLFPATGARQLFFPPRRYIFGIYANYEMEAKLHADYIANIIDDPKVFVMRYDTDFGKNTSLSLQEQLGHYGIKIVGEATHKYNTVDFSSHALAAKKAGANVVAIYSLGPPPAKIALECQKLGFKPQFITFSSCNVDQMPKLAGSAVEGLVGTHLMALIQYPHPEMEKFLELYKKAFPDKEPEQIVAAGYFAMRNVVEAIRQTGRDLTRENLIKTLESWENFDSIDFGPLTYGPDRRQGPDHMTWITVKDGKFEYLVPNWHTWRRFE